VTVAIGTGSCAVMSYCY